MKTKAMLRLGLLLMYITFMVCCKGTETEPRTIETSSIVTAIEDHSTQETAEETTEDFTASDSKTQVYICKSSGAKRYHFSATCRGIKRCTHEVAKVSVETAKGYGLSVCGYER